MTHNATHVRDQIAPAKAAARSIATIRTDAKNAALTSLADAIEARSSVVIDANKKDVEQAQSNGLAEAKLARLIVTEDKVAQAAEGIRQIVGLPDPVGEVTDERTADTGLRVQRVRVPLGVIAMIYEARPLVTVDAFALCFKAGNACVLKGGREATHSNLALGEIVRSVLRDHGLDPHAITPVQNSDRAALAEMLKLDDLIDLVIPRGGERLIRFVHEHATIPTIQHFKGVCHLYIDKAADLDMALDIAVTAKTSAPATCNALECVLVHADIDERFIPFFAQRCAEQRVELVGDLRSVRLAPTIDPAAQSDFGREFLELKAAVGVVPSLEAALDHIAEFGSGHTEAIVTEDRQAAARFLSHVDASCVLHNASTRFNDGFQLGLGAEIGISTSKLHAYGPMGLEELTTRRFVVHGNGQTR